MALKYLIVVVAIICAFQLYEAARLVPRSADGTTVAPDVLQNVRDTISRQLESWKQGAEELINNAPSVDHVVANLTTHFQTWSNKVESAAKDLVQQINPSTAAP